MYNRDVVRLGRELDSIWNDAARLGKRFDKDLKKSTLYCCTAQDWFYTNSVDALKTAKPDCKYDEAYHALAKKQQDGEVTGRIRGAARVATSTEQGSTNQAEQGPRGRLDPRNPSAPPKCYACGGPNHIARNCTNTNNNPALSRDGPTTNPAQEASRMLLTSTSKDGQICTAGNERLQVKAIGDASLWVGDVTIQLLDVLYMPKLNSNLLSVQGLIENGARVTFDEFGTIIKQNDGTQIQYKRNRRKGWFKVQGKALALELEETLDDVPEDNQNTGKLDNAPEGNKDTKHRDSYLWHESQGKQTRARMGQSESERMEAPLELVHVDLMTDFKGHANYHYALVAVDDFSSLIYVEPLCTKSATLMALRRWIARMEQATDRKLKTLRSDNGGEWCSIAAEDWQTQEGFKWQKSIPGISVQNGRAERAIRSLEGLEAMGTWEVVHQPPGVPLVDSKVVLRLKLDADGVPVKHKAQLVARGFTQREGIDYQETFSPVAPLGAIRAILALAVQNNWEVHALDITMAYLNSTLKEAIYMKPPEGSGVAPGKVYKVVKGLYGLKQSGREWNQEFNRSLRRMGFFQVECAPCIYTKGQGEDMAIVVIYVDDTLVIAPRLETVLKVKKQIGQRWKMEDSGEVSHFLGIKISRDRVMRTMTIGQSGYIDQVLAKHLDKRTKPTMVPMQSIPEGTLVASAAQQKEYPVIVGKLLWVANSTRPDLSLTVGVLTRHMREPSQEHYQAAQRVLCYLESTKQVGLVYRASESQEPLVAHSDANWASDATIQRRSTSGSVVLVYRNPVAWKSATQKCVSLSAVKAEFIAATEATREVLFLKQLLRSIGIATGTPTVYSDNTGCIQVSKDPAQHWKLKHIDTKYHFVRNNIQEGRVQIKYVDTTRNLADVLTKPIGRQAMQQARSGLHLQILTAVYEMGSPSYATVLKNGGHTLKQQHNEQGTYTVEGGS
ncbi:uncharacterized protein UDID_18750 [Ustilago sp. UG-2017a]|nr:uncharacterized protein UDID_18750 [Ustilago sp. UG-2017a]